MKTFEYRGLDRSGRPRKGLVEAISVKDARERLAAEGVLVEKIAPAGRRARFPAELRATLYRELSALLAAGIPIVRALDNLIQSPDMAPVRTLLAGVRDRVKEGASLADALAEASGSVSAFERALIAAAERAGDVDATLERLAGFLEEEERIRARVQTALIYPLIVATVGVCVAILMLGLLVPRARELLAAGNLPLPAITRFMVGVSALVGRWGAAAAAVIAVFVCCVVNRLRRDPKLRERLDRRLFALPLVGPGYTLLVNVRFARTLALLLEGGVGMIEGIQLAGRATGSAWVARLAETEAETVRHGGTLSEAVRKIPPLKSTLPGWIYIGEASGGLARLLENAGRRYQERWERFVTRSLGLLEPFLIIVIGGFVLLVTLSVLLPVISLTRAVVG